MRRDHLLTVLSLFLLVPASITWAQSIIQQKGLITAEFTVPQGSIKIYLPDDIRSGDVISGRISTTPSGKNARQMENNLAGLQKYSVRVGNENIPVQGRDNAFRFSVTSDRILQNPLELLSEGRVRMQTNASPRSQTSEQRPVPANCIIPRHALTGSPLAIPGRFDGDLSTTSCTLDNRSLQILAESPRETVAFYPTDTEGMHAIQVSEAGQSACLQNVSGVNMNVSAGRQKLVTGEQTYIEVSIRGLQNLPDTAILTLLNITSDVVIMMPSNLIVIPLLPDSLGSGVFNRRFDIRSLRTGTFTVNIDLELPDAFGNGPTGNPPGTETKPPVTNETEKHPPTTTQPNQGKCTCSGSATIIAGANNSGQLGFSAGPVNAKCTGTCGAPPKPCTVTSVAYSWKVTSGNSVVKINGAANGNAVTLTATGTGSYVLALKVTVVCCDGTECVFVTNHEGNIPPTTTTNNCILVPEEIMEPKMDGGLKPKYSAAGKQIRRDDFIELGAEGLDFDQLKWTCTPSPNCRDTKSEKTISLNGRIRFEWNIQSGEGSFVQLGCLPENVKTGEGDNIIFKPPVVPLPVKAADTSITTTIKLSIIDDNPTQPQDPKVDRTITIITKRSKSLLDFYSVSIKSDRYTLPSAVSPPAAEGTCRTVGPVWEKITDLTVPTIILPGVPDNDKMVLGQWILLSSNDQRDADLVTLECESASDCPTAPYKKDYEDHVAWTWSIASGGGKFISDPTGRFIIYEAPLDLKGKPFVDVTIKVKVKNTGGKINDTDPGEGEKKFRVYQPGVKLSHPELAWLPEDNNSLELSSELMYNDGGWKPALAHMCRIHYFELVNVSAEKGVCLNAPAKEIDQCKDLHVKNENEHEGFNDKGGANCKSKNLYQQARTQKPVKEYAITVYSRDFGSYGFLRSFANVNKGGKDSIRGETPVYIPIPAHEAHQLKHPLGRAKKINYNDNRVTIPYDIDENHIADDGWTAFGGVKVTDPAINNDDDDELPAGDSFNGDGLAIYEEYRGFKVIRNKTVEHIRTNYKVKDIFIRNKDDLDITLYAAVTQLDVHEIREDQYVDDNKRVVNSNFNPVTHVVDQMGLKLVNAGSGSGSLLGIADSKTGQPTIPNWIREVRVYKTRVESSCKSRKLPDCDAKLMAVIAHELSHGNNVCHHGEGDPDVVQSQDGINGLRSGNLECVMRYDNVGTPIRGATPETPGTSLCVDAAGTGYNANGNLFGNAAAGRGNCKAQVRVSAKGGLPKTCGNR